MHRFPWWAAGSVALNIAVAILVPWLGSNDPYAIAATRQFGAPSWTHPLGLDELGRDVLSRLLWGSRTSLGIALAAAAFGSIVGVLFAWPAGFLRGAVEAMILSSTEALLCFPPLLLAVTLMGVGYSTLIPRMALVFLPSVIRIACASVLSIHSQDQVEAVRVLGAGRVRVIAGTILPSIAGLVLVRFSPAASATITLESGLSFIGLGVAPPTPTWGA